MVSVVDAQREILLTPIGTNVWSGQVPQTENSAAVTWSLAKQLYGFNGPYWIVPLSLVIGMVPTAIQWLICKVHHEDYLFSIFKISRRLLKIIIIIALAQNWISESRQHHTTSHLPSKLLQKT